MNKKFIYGRSIKDILIAVGPSLLLLVVTGLLALRYVNPAPPARIVISTGDGEGDYDIFAERYRDIIKHHGVTLEIRPSSGARENLKRLSDPKSEIDVTFVQDGLGAEIPADAESLGSLYFEPMWVFYRGKTELKRFSQLRGKKVAIGEQGGGTASLALRLLEASGLTGKDFEPIRDGWSESAEALKSGKIDAAFFVAPPDDSLIQELAANPSLRLMSVDQAEAITRSLPFLHHLTLPHGALDLGKNIPEHDVDLVATTAVLLARESLHPALVDLLLEAAFKVHSRPGIFAKENDFPADRDSDFDLSPEAKRYYKSGTRFWQRYLPFWLANLVERFTFIVLPMFALLLPLMKLAPQIYAWRIRRRIHKRYGELKYLETQLKSERDAQRFAEHMAKLDGIEERVNQLKVPLEYAPHIYGLREHIDFVRGKIAQERPRHERVS